VLPKPKGRLNQVAKRKLPRGKMKGKQRGSAVKVKSYYRKVKGRKTRIKVKAYRRGRPGGKRG